MIETKGESTITYPLKNVVKLFALAWICQGQVAQPPKKAVKNAPLWILIYFGKRNAKSFDEAIELVEMLVPSVARPKANAQKNLAALFSHKETIWVGSQ